MVDRLMMHLKPDELMDYFDGTLDDQRVRDHLSTCFQCRSRLKDLSLTRTMLSPPREEVPGGHVPPEILGQYIEDTLSMEQNRAVEDHLGECRRCLADLVSLRIAVSMPLDKMPPEAAAAGVKEKLDDYRGITPLGSLSFKRFRDQVNLAFMPVPETDDPEACNEQSARYRFPFGKGADLKSRVESMAYKAKLEVRADMLEDAAAAPLPAFEAGGMLHRRMPSDPSARVVTTDTAMIIFSLEGRTFTMELRDLAGEEPLEGVQITLTPVSGKPGIFTTDPAGRASLPIPDGPSTLRVFLEKTCELDISSLL